MNSAIKCLLVTVALLNTAPFVTADDLFSEITNGSVFASSASTRKETSTETGNGRRLSGIHSIRKAAAEVGLRQAASQEQPTNGAVTVVVATPQLNDGSMNVRVSLTDSKASVVLSASLVQLDRSKSQSADLRNLVSKAGSGGIRFALANNTLQIRSTFDNQNINPSDLKTKINDLLDRAASTASTWRKLGTTAAIAQKSQPNETSLVGKWTTDITQNTNYAIRFEQTRFKLGIVVNGKFSKTEGTWAIANNELTLSGDGLSMSGNISVESAEQFVLTFNNQRLKFVRSK